MTFEGKSCNIANNKKNLIKKLGTKNRQVMREVLAEYKYYIMRAQIKFEKKQ